MNRWLWSLILATIILCHIAGAQEMQVPLDSAGRVEVVDRGLEKSIGAFSQYEGFREARLYLTPDSSYFLEVLVQNGGRTMRQRVPMTSGQVDSLRRAISRMIFARAPTAGLDRSGRWALVRSTIEATWGYYAWALPDAARMEGTSYASAYFVIGAVGYLVPLMVTSRGRISEADAILWSHGLHHGILHGGLLYVVAVGDKVDEEDNERRLLTAGIVGGISEAIAGLAIASRPSMTAGRAAMIGRCGSIGTLCGVGVAGAMNNFEDKHLREDAAVILGGAAAGMLAGNSLGRSRRYSVGDAGIIGSASFLGAGLPIALLVASEVEEETTYYVVGTGGLLAGAAIGSRFVRKVDYSESDSRLAAAGATGGALLGLGLTVGTESGRTMAMASALGAVGGFAFVLITMEPLPGQASLHGGRRPLYDIEPHFTLLPTGQRRHALALGATVRF